jgi:DNA-binding MarR family transcriptional regulator
MLLLQDRGEIQASDLRIVSKNYAKIALLAKELEAAGLVEKEIVTSPRMTYNYRLTEKGKMVAKKLKEIEEIIIK